MTPDTGGDSLLDEARAIEHDLEKVRRDLHRHPELSWREHRTTADVARRLVELGLDPVPFEGMTGVTADVVLGPGPVVVLRADLDALPLDDLTGGPDASEVPGVSHACGHDVHTTALLGAAALLVDRIGAAEGTVRLVFQPAEEAIPGGAPEVLATGRLDDVDAIAALHCDPSLTVGRFGVRAGAITSAADRLHFELRGEGGHTARPHLTDDLVGIVSRLAVELPERVATACAELGPVSIVFGHVEAGEAPNVIPSRAVLEGTLRTRSKQVWVTAPEVVERVATDVLGRDGPRWTLTHERGNPPVVNDPVVTDVARDALISLVGDEGLVEAEQSLGSEDFSWYLDRLPGTYIRLGVSPDDRPSADLHCGDFRVAPGSVVHGAAALAIVALALLGA